MCIYMYFIIIAAGVIFMLYRLSIKQAGLLTKTRMRYPTQFRGS